MAASLSSGVQSTLKYSDTLAHLELFFDFSRLEKGSYSRRAGKLRDGRCGTRCGAVEGFFRIPRLPRCGPSSKDLGLTLLRMCHLRLMSFRPILRRLALPQLRHSNLPSPVTCVQGSQHPSFRWLPHCDWYAQLTAVALGLRLETWGFLAVYSVLLSPSLPIVASIVSSPRCIP